MNIELEVSDGQTWSEVVLMNVLHAPKMPFNFFSVGSVLDGGYTHSVDSEMSVLKDPDGIVRLIAMREDKVWKMKFRIGSSDLCLVNMSLRKWNEKLAHQNVGSS